MVMSDIEALLRAYGPIHSWLYIVVILQSYLPDVVLAMYSYGPI